MTDVSSGFEGQLGARDLIDLLRQLHRLGANGILHVETATGKGQIHLRQGGLRVAFFADFVGVNALTRLIMGGAGSFRLAAPSVEAAPRNIPHETSFVLDSIGKVLGETDANRAARNALRTPLPDDFSNPAASAPQTERIANFHPPQIGDIIGKCRLVEEIGQGASSLVYRAHHQALDIDVVLKVLMQGGGPSHHRLMTANEARLLARLNHPNIVRIFDFDDVGRHPHLVVELIDGPSLSALIRSRSRLTLSELVPIATQTTEALSYAHDVLGLIHCDIKPDNILLTAQGQAKLADLGLAKSKQIKSTISSEIVVGTPSYIAPEQIQGGHQAADHRCDIYSLGATFYHALVGRPPFEHEDPLQLMLMRLHADPLAPNLVDPGIDRRMSDLIMAMLVRDPARRIQSYDEVLTGLTETGEHRRLSESESNIIRRRSSFWRAVPDFFRRGDAGIG